MWTRARRDDSEPEIVEALREEGCSVTYLSAKGVPDLLVGFEGAWHLVECKTGNAELTDDQVEWQKAQAGEPVQIARNQAQARKLVRVWRNATAVQAERRQRLNEMEAP